MQFYKPTSGLILEYLASDSRAISFCIFVIHVYIVSVSFVAIVTDSAQSGLSQNLFPKKLLSTPMISGFLFTILHTGPPESPKHVPSKFIDDKRQRIIYA